MSNKFYLTLVGDGIEALKGAAAQAEVIEELEIENLNEEVVAALIEANKPIGTLILEEEFIDGTLLTKLLSAVNVGDLLFPGAEAEAHECCGECECEKEEKEEKKEKEEKQGELKFKDVDIESEEGRNEVCTQLLNPAVRTVKFKGCGLSASFLEWLLNALSSGHLPHIESISIGKDPKAIEWIQECTLPQGWTSEPKKKDGILLKK